MQLHHEAHDSYFFSSANTSWPGFISSPYLAHQLTACSGKRWTPCLSLVRSKPRAVLACNPSTNSARSCVRASTSHVVLSANRPALVTLPKATFLLTGCHIGGFKIGCFSGGMPMLYRVLPPGSVVQRNSAGPQVTCKNAYTGLRLAHV